MLKLTDSPAWTSVAEDIRRRVDRGTAVALRLPAPARRMAATIHRGLPGALHVAVPAGADQVERVLLALAAQAGPAQQQARLGHALADAADDLGPVLGMLDAALAGRSLLVSDWDALGTAGANAELGLALRPRTRALGNWLAERAQVLTFQRRAPEGFWRPQSPTEPSVQLVNGGVQDTSELLEQVGAGSQAYALGLATMALGCGQDEVAGLAEDDLRARLWDLLPPSARAILLHLGLHDRPLPRDHLPTGATPEAIELGAQLGLWTTAGADLIIEAGWSDALRHELSRERVRRAHLELADSFLRDFQFRDESSWAVGVSVLEAHRHLVAAGELERARQCWRFGVPLMLEAARQRSQERRFDEAARLYEAVVGAVDRGEIAAPAQLRGYARHYLHYNRFRAESEDQQSTEQGYRRALQDWSTNALFWSRLVRVQFYLNRPAEALMDLAEAQRVVEEHPRKQTFLVARSVDGLLLNGRIVEAIQIWGDYQPDSAYAEEVAENLAQVLERGWTVERLLLDPNAPLFFTRPLRIEIVRSGRRWTAELRELNSFAVGEAPLRALKGLMTRLRGECEELIRAYTHTLSPEDRMRKRLLLGAVDVVTSRLDAAAPSEWWVMGQLERDADGRLWLRAGDARAECYEVPEALAAGIDNLPHLARVAADEAGVPIGPVLELLPGFRGSDEELWRAWQERVNNAC